MKPTKPRPDFPLTPHGSGQWCRKFRGRTVYFGTDAESALARYLDEKDDLMAGRTPAPRSPTWGYALDRFLSSKKLLVQAGELTERSYDDYVRTTDRLAELIDPGRALTSIKADDLEKLRAGLVVGKNGALSAGTVRGLVTRTRMVCLYVVEILGVPLPYRKIVKQPQQRHLRTERNRRGPRLFTAKQIKTMLKAANPKLRAMIYLGINCAYGPNDVGTLKISSIKGGWVTHWREKTGNERRCPLWEETSTALEEVIGERTEGLVFLTLFGNPYTDASNTRDNAISFQFRQLLVKLGMFEAGRTGFYNLRRTFETIGQTTKDQVAVDFIMGHIPPTQDMSAVYRQRVFDKQLSAVTTRVRSWLLGRYIA